MTKIKTVPFDAADFINTPEDVATFLQAAFDEALKPTILVSSHKRSASSRAPRA